MCCPACGCANAGMRRAGGVLVRSGLTLRSAACVRLLRGTRRLPAIRGSTGTVPGCRYLSRTHALGRPNMVVSCAGLPLARDRYRCAGAAADGRTRVRQSAWQQRPATCIRLQCWLGWGGSSKLCWVGWDARLATTGSGCADRSQSYSYGAVVNYGGRGARLRCVFQATLADVGGGSGSPRRGVRVTCGPAGACLWPSAWHLGATHSLASGRPACTLRCGARRQRAAPTRCGCQRR
jgi:hypothetical protein